MTPADGIRADMATAARSSTPGPSVRIVPRGTSLHHEDNEDLGEKLDMQQAERRGLRRRGAKDYPAGRGGKALYSCILSERSAEGAKTQGAAVCTRPHIARGGGEKTHGCPAVHITVCGKGERKDAQRCRKVRAPPYTAGWGGGGMTYAGPAVRISPSLAATKN